MKELSNDDFFTNWQSSHEKGLFQYLLKNTLPILLMIFICDFAFILIGHHIEAETIGFIIYFFALTGFIYFFTGILKWLSSEKRYRYINAVREETKQERDGKEC